MERDMTSFSAPFLCHDIPSQDNENVSLKVEKVLTDHQYGVNSLLYFGPPHNKIVSCSRDYTIRIWNSETFECMKIIKKHTSSRRKNTIMPANYYDSLTTYFVPGCNQWKLSFFVMRKKKYSKSSTYPHCFYVATSDKHEAIKLVNYKTDEVVKNHNNERIRCLCLFHNSKNEEILIACRTSRKIYTYNTSHPKFDTKIRISQIEKWWEEKDFELHRDRLQCCFSYNNQYLFCACTSGSLYFYEFQEPENSIKKIKEHKVIRQRICDLLFLPDRQIILTCSRDNAIIATRIRGLSIKTNFDVLDRKERFEYLLEYMKVDSQFFFKVLILQFGDPLEILVPKWSLYTNNHDNFTVKK